MKRVPTCRAAGETPSSPCLPHPETLATLPQQYENNLSTRLWKVHRAMFWKWTFLSVSEEFDNDEMLLMSEAIDKQENRKI
mgnify:CR=1 FL=1